MSPACGACPPCRRGRAGSNHKPCMTHALEECMAFWLRQPGVSQLAAGQLSARFFQPLRGHIISVILAAPAVRAAPSCALLRMTPSMPQQVGPPPALALPQRTGSHALRPALQPTTWPPACSTLPPVSFHQSLSSSPTTLRHFMAPPWGALPADQPRSLSSWKPGLAPATTQGMAPLPHSPALPALARPTCNVPCPNSLTGCMSFVCRETLRARPCPLSLLAVAPSRTRPQSLATRGHG